MINLKIRLILFSCINTQKVIESLQSRCSIIKIKPIKKIFKNNTKNIKNKENIDIDSDVENFLIKISNNSIRLLINYLEKFKLLNLKITKKTLQIFVQTLVFMNLKIIPRMVY